MCPSDTFLRSAGVNTETLPLFPGDVRLIDCEHMGYNYPGFDIAHLFVGVTGLQPGMQPGQS